MEVRHTGESTEAREYAGLRKSCTLCTHQHLACDGKQPCQRCVEWGKAAQCVFVLSRKRGRPQKRTTPPAPTTDKRTHGCKRRQPPSADGVEQSADKLATRVILPAPKTTTTTTTTASLQPRVGYQPNSTETQTGAVVAQQRLPPVLLSLLVDQVRSLNKENRRLVDRVTSLQNQQTVFEQQMDGMRAEHHKSTAWLLDQLATLQEYSTLRVRMPFDLLSQPIEPRSHMHLSALTRILPFLAHYDLSQELVITDFRQPFASCSVSQVGSEMLIVYIYASLEYSGLMGYGPCELVGMDVATVVHPGDENTRDGMLASMMQPPVPSGIGLIFTLRPVVICKDRSLLTVWSRHQYLYDSEGRHKWVLSVVDRVLPKGADALRSSEDKRLLRHSPLAPSPAFVQSLDSSPLDGPLSSASDLSNPELRLDQELDELLHALSPPSPGIK